MGNCIATNKVANLVSNYGFGKQTPGWCPIVLEWAIKGETLGKGNRLHNVWLQQSDRNFHQSGVYVGFQEVQEAIDIVL